MDDVKRFPRRDRQPQVPQDTSTVAPKRPTLHCDICNSQDVRLVSGGKYRCLTCGYLPS